MKYNSLISVILLSAAQAAMAQPEDITVQMSYWPIRFAHEASRENLKESRYTIRPGFSDGQINEIELKRTKSAGRGALIGAVAGALIEAVAGRSRRIDADLGKQEIYHWR
jgi:hypothetical protein